MLLGIVPVKKDVVVWVGAAQVAPTQLLVVKIGQRVEPDTNLVKLG